MKKLFTRSVKENGYKLFKGLFPLMLFLFLLPTSNFAQLFPGTVDIGIFEAATPNTMEIRVRPTDPTTLTMTNVQFTLKWPEGTNNITAGPPIYPYMIFPQGPVVNYLGYNYQIFASAGGFGLNWPTGNTEYVACTFTYSENCGVFEIADDAWSNDPQNNGVYYFEIIFPATGIIYQPTVDNCTGPPVSVIAYAIPNNICEGGSSQLEAIAVDGSGTYTYSWVSDPAGFTSTIFDPIVNPIITTTYTVTVDDGATTASDEVTVTVNPNPVADAGADQTICEGECVDLTGSGGVDYLWNTGGTDAMINVCPGVTTMYTLTVTDANGCTGSDEVEVVVNPAPHADIMGNLQICMGECTKLTASGGVSYAWSTGETTGMVIVCPTAITLYTVTVTDANGCTDEAYVEVWFKATAVADAGPDVAICEGDCTTLTASGGDTYEWSTGNANGFFFSEYAEGSSNNKYLELYNGTGADVVLSDYEILTNYNGNPWSGSHLFPPGAILAPGDVWIIANSSADPIIVAEADEVFSYGESGFIVNFNGDDVRALVRIVCGDTTIVDIIGRYDLIDPGSGWPVAGVPDGTKDHTLVRKSTVCTGNPDWDMAAGTDANDSEWIVYPQNDWTYIGSHTGCAFNGNTQSITVCPITTTTYTVTVTNIDGCTASDDVTVTVNPMPTVDAGPDVTVCEGDCTTLSGSGNGTFMWSTGETTGDINVCPTTTTTYTLTIIDANGCCNNDEVTVSVAPAAYAFAGDDLTVCTGNCGTLIGQGNGDFMWSTGETTASISVCPTTLTTYTLLVTTVDGCTASDDVAVDVSQSAYADAGPDQTICESECTTLSGCCNGTYEWSTGQTTDDIAVCPSTTTTYTLTVTDFSGCTGTDDVTVFVNPVPVADAGDDESICIYDCIWLSGSGGGDYMWSTGETTNDIEVCPITTTSYYLTVTANGCSSSDEVVITVFPEPIVSVTGDMEICEGECTTLTANGGVAYEWSTGATTQSVTLCPLTTTNYHVIITDQNGCDTWVEFQIVVHPLPIPNAGPEATICQGECTMITAGGGGTYFWSNSSTQPYIEVCPLATTTYTVTVTSIDGCTAIDEVTITVDAAAYADAGPDVTICEYDCTTLSASGNGSFEWSTGETNGDITVCPAVTTTYTLSVTTTGGCTAADEVVVTVYSNPTAVITGNTMICDGECTTLTASGGSPLGGDSYHWNTGETTMSIVVCPTATEMYAVTITNVYGCSGLADVLVTVHSSPVADAGSDITIPLGNSANLAASATGGLGPTYGFDWSTGDQGPNITVSPTITTTYTVTATDELGCSDSDEVMVTVIAPLADIIISEIMYNPPESGTDTLEFIEFYNRGTNAVNLDGYVITQGVVFTFPNHILGPGEYVCVCYNLNAFTNFYGKTAYEWTSGGLSNGGEDIELQDGMGNQIAYVDYDDSPPWPTEPDGNGPSLTFCNVTLVNNDPLNWSASTEYVGTVNNTDVYATPLEGCQLAPPLTVDAGIDVAICDGDLTNLMATVAGGVPQYTYSWTPVAGLNDATIENPTASPSTTTTYVVVVTDNAGTTASDDVVVTVNPLPNASAGPDVAICDGDCTTLSAGGGAMYIWSTGETMGDINVCPTTTTTYYVTVTDTDGCSAEAMVTVTVNPGLVISAGPDVAICEGECTTLTVSGGIMWIWSNGETMGDINVCPTTTTTYYVTATDIDGCSAEANVTVTVNPAPVADAGPDVAICEGDCTTLSASGGSMYVWSTGETMGDINVCPIVTTTYYVTVTDIDGCSAEANVTVTVNPAPVADAGPDVDICEGDCTTLSASGGAMYIWSTGETVGDINVCPAVTTTYYVTVTDINGCSAEAMVTVTVNPFPVVSAGPDLGICEGECTTLSASGAAMYVWSTGETMGDIYVCPTTATTYYVTGTDISGCSAEAMATVTVNPAPNADAGPDVTICGGACTDLTATGGVLYSWNTGETTATINVCPAFTTTYTVSVMDANGCMADAEVTVTVDPSPQITLQPTDQTVNEGNDAIFTVFAMNATTYDWEVSTDGGLTWVPAGSGASLTVFSTTLAMDGNQYRCVVNGPCPPAIISDVAILTVLPIVPPAVVTVLPKDTVCDYGGIIVPIDVVKLENCGAISLTMSYDPTVLVFSHFQNVHPALSIGNFLVNDIGGTAFVSWYTVGSVPVNILYGTLVELAFTSPAGGCTDLTWDTITPGYCEYADPFGSILPSTFVDGNICVKTGPTIITNPVDVTVEEGQPAIFNVTANNALTYTWEVSEDGGATWNFAGTGSMLIVSPTTIDMDGNQYRCVVTGECLPDAVSLVATLNVNPIITTILGTATACAGDIVVPIFVEHFYGVASLSYTFGYNTLGLSYVGIQNAHSELNTGALYANEISGGIIKISWASLTPANIGDGTVLELIFNATNPSVSNLIWDLGTPGNCEYDNLASNNISSIWINGAITVNGIPIAYTVTGGGEFCEFGMGVEIGLSGSQPNVMYELLVNGVPLTAPVQGTGWAFSFGLVPTAGTFTVNAEDINTLCFNDMLGSVDVVINPNPVVDAGADQSMLLGTSATIDATVSGGTPGYTYLWAPDGQVTEDITVSPAVNTMYTLTGTDSKGCMATDDVLVEVYTNILSGHINYDNAASTVMNNVNVDLVTDPGAFVVQSTVTDAQGYFEFGPQANGNYYIVSSCAKPWGGVNSTDALIIMEHFVGSISLSGIRLIAADVNASGFVNAGDALFAAQRFAYVINSFPAGDWAFENQTFTLNEADLHLDELALCFGDVNGSYTPPYVKVVPKIDLTNNGVIEINDQAFEVPVTIDRDLEIGAVSLILNYPEGLDILEVNAEFDDLIYTTGNGQLRISWFNTTPVYLSKDEVLITLTVKANIENAIFNLGNLSELADGYANVISDASLNIPKLVKTGSLSSEYSMINYPNPFSTTTTIEYSIAEDADVTITVFNLLGEAVNTLVSEYQTEGTYFVEFNGTELNSGLYYYKIETLNFVKTNTMVINK